MWRAVRLTELDPRPRRAEIIFGQRHGDTFGARWPRPSIALGAADKAFAKTVDLDDGTTAVGESDINFPLAMGSAGGECLAFSFAAVHARLRNFGKVTFRVSFGRVRAWKDLATSRFSSVFS